MQVVAGSNPVTPTIKKNAGLFCPAFFLLWWQYRSAGSIQSEGEAELRGVRAQRECFVDAPNPVTPTRPIKKVEHCSTFFIGP